MGIGQTEQTKIWALARPNRPKFGYSPDRTDRNLGIGQTEQTKNWVLARSNRPKFGYWPDRTDLRPDHCPDRRPDHPPDRCPDHWPDRTDRNMGIDQTEQTKIWVLARPIRPKFGYWPDRTGRNLGIGQTEQTEIWLLAKPNRPKYGYWSDRTDRIMGIGQTEQTEIWVFARPNKLKLPLAIRKARPNFFSRPLWTVAPDPPVRDPSWSGQYLSWVADFILGSQRARILTKTKLPYTDSNVSSPTCQHFFPLHHL